MSDAVDPAVKAAAELNAILDRMEAPCHVHVTACCSGNDGNPNTGGSDAGKYMKATAPVASKTVLFEEIPLVSWPAPQLLSLGIPFCFHCLAINRSPFTTTTTNTTSTDGDGDKNGSTWVLSCRTCGSWFCSPECERASARVHQLLCSSLASLRELHSTTTTTTDHNASKEDGREEGESVVVITAEALARSAACLITRLASSIQQSLAASETLTAEAVESDYLLSVNSDSNGANGGVSGGGGGGGVSQGIAQQFFSAASSSFNRFISCPDSVLARMRTGGSYPLWVSSVQKLLGPRSRQLLSLTILPYRSSEGKETLQWVEALVTAALSEDTLYTLLGQLQLNAHAINEFILNDDIASGSGNRNDGGSTSAKTRLFDWFIKGGGMYCLLANFNHSCRPNVCVSSAGSLSPEDSEGGGSTPAAAPITHEIALCACRGIEAGEELCISYIPLTEESGSATRSERRRSCEERRTALKESYYFTCMCPRCVEESSL